MTNEPNVSEMFGGDEAKIKTQINALAEHIAIEMQAVDDLKREHTDRKEALDSSKEKLNRMLTEAGMKSCKLENGLTPSSVTKMKYYPTVSPQALHNWLHSVNLADIIKRTVHFGTLQSTLVEYEQQGNDIPDSVFNKSPKYGIRMGGKSAFLLTRKDGQNGD